MSDSLGTDIYTTLDILNGDAVIECVVSLPDSEITPSHFTSNNLYFLK